MRNQSQPQLGLSVPSQQTARPSVHPQVPLCQEQQPRRAGSKMLLSERETTTLSTGFKSHAHWAFVQRLMPVSKGSNARGAFGPAAKSGSAKSMIAIGFFTPKSSQIKLKEL